MCRPSHPRDILQGIALSGPPPSLRVCHVRAERERKVVYLYRVCACPGGLEIIPDAQLLQVLFDGWKPAAVTSVGAIVGYSVTFNPTQPKLQYCLPDSTNLSRISQL